MSNRRMALLLGCALLVAACGGDAGQEGGAGAAAAAGTGGPAEQTYAPQLGVDIGAMNRTESGLYVQDVAEGTGQVAQAGQRVAVHYTGWLPNGTEFDSSRGGDPFEFGLGQGEVIPGWDEGVAGMREGGRRRLVIPSELAYGAQGIGPIPPNATLVFDVELLQVR